MVLSVFPPYFYLFAWALLSFLPYFFFSQNVYFVFLLYFVISALFYSFYAIIKYNLPVYFKALFMFVSFLSVYGLYFAIVGPPVYWQDAAIYLDGNTFLLWLFTSMLSVVPIYVFTCKGLIDEKIMKILFFVMLVSSMNAFRCSYANQMKLALMTGSMQEEFTITCAYYFLSILPLVMLFKKKYFLQLLLLCVMFVYFILSAKRGAIVLGTVCSLLIVLSMFNKSTLKKKLLIVFVFLVSIVGIYEFVIYQIQTSPYFSLRIDQTLEGYTSGRKEYGEIIWNHIMNRASPIEFLLGNGAHGTLLVNESFAHNDWLAIFLEQGLIGVILFLLYWICFVFSWIKSKVCFDAFVVLGLLLIIGFGKTMFSMYYMPISPEMIVSSGFFAIVLGYYLAKAYPQDDVDMLKMNRDGND